MAEETSQTTRDDEGTTESDSGNDQVPEWDLLASPLDNWRKRGHIRAEPETLRTGADVRVNGQSNESD